MTRTLLAALTTIAMTAVGDPAVASSPTIATLAGGPVAPAPAIGLAMRPAGVAYAPDGSMLLTDAAGGRVWRVGQDGLASVVAGSGRPCSIHVSRPDGDDCEREGGGDFGPATMAHLTTPSAIAVAPSGDIFVSEPEAHDVRMIDAESGTISTILGTGEPGFDIEFDDNVPGRDARVTTPQDLTVDSLGRLYVADTGARLVRRIDGDGTVRIAAGCVTGCTDSLRDRSSILKSVLPNLTAIAVGPADQLFVATAIGVYRLDRPTDQYRRVTGDYIQEASSPGHGEGGTAAQARYRDISAIAFGPDGRLFILDRAWSRVRAIDAPVSAERTIRHVAGDGTNGFDGDGGAAVDAAFNVNGETRMPGGIAVGPDGDLAIGDVRNGRLRVVKAADGVVRTVAGSGLSGLVNRISLPNDFQPSQVRGGYAGDGGPATRAQLWMPADVVADNDGNLFVADVYAHRVRRIDAGTGLITTVAGSGCAGCNQGTAPLGDGGPATSASVANPSALALDRTGTQLVIADRGHNRVRQVNLGSQPVTVYPSPGMNGASITIQPGAIATIIGSGATCSWFAPDCGDARFATAAAFEQPGGLAFDPGNTLYFTDVEMQLVRRVDRSSGIVSSIVGFPGWSNCDGRGDEGLPGAATLLCGPSDLAFGPDGALYVTEGGTYGIGSGVISDQEGPRVRRIDLTATGFPSSIVVGTGVAGPQGDGGPAREAQLGFANDLAFGSDGTMYLADTGNARVRAVRGGTITTLAGTGSFLNHDGFDDLGIAGCSAAGDGGPAASAGLCAPLSVAVGPGGALYVADSMNNRIRVVTGL